MAVQKWQRATQRNERETGLLTICLATMLFVSCAQTGPARAEVIDAACEWVKPINGTDHNWDKLDRQTKEEILSHNKA